MYAGVVAKSGQQECPANADRRPKDQESEEVEEALNPVFCGAVHGFHRA